MFSIKHIYPIQSTGGLRRVEDWPPLSKSEFCQLVVLKLTYHQFSLWLFLLSAVSGGSTQKAYRLEVKPGRSLVSCMVAAEIDMPYSVIMWTNSFNLYTSYSWFFSFENPSIPSTSLLRQWQWRRRERKRKRRRRWMRRKK